MCRHKESVRDHAIICCVGHMPPAKENGKPGVVPAMPSAKAGTQRKTGGNTSTPPKAISSGLPKTPNLRASSDSLTLSPASSQCKEMQGLASHASMACTSMAAWSRRVNPGIEGQWRGACHDRHVSCPPTCRHACHPLFRHACTTALEPRNKPGGIIKRVPPPGGDAAAAAAVRQLGKRVSISGGRITPTLTPRLDAARWGLLGSGGNSLA